MEVMKMKGVAKYEAYRESETGFIGEIPINWKEVPNKHIFKLKKNQVGKKSVDYDLLSLTLKGIVVRNLDNGGKFPAEFDTYQEVKKGDFVFCLFDVEETPRTVGLSDFDGMITGAYTVMGTTDKFDRTFLYYFYLNLDSKKRLKSLYKGLRNTIPKESFFCLKTFVPPLPEQISIATFLDDKTVKIDQAITQKEQLIVLLKERKQILIQELVTGKKVWDEASQSWIKPKATVDSGVEWIGEIPNGWKVLRVASILRQTNIPGEEGLSVLSVSIHSAVSDRELTDEENIRGTVRSDDKSVYKKVKEGDIVYNMMRAWQGAIGSVSVIGMVSPAYVTARFIKSFNSNYFEHLFRTPDFINVMNQYSKGITDFRKRLYWNEFKQLPILQPPINQQNKIIDFINSYSVGIDSSISNCQLQIEKLKEYKSVLIDSAVTGKLRVPSV